MYHIHGLTISSNTTKTIFVAEELGIDYKFTQMDISKGEHKTPEHFKRHPLGKVPTLTHGEITLFESGAICRYLASTEKSELYPVNDNLTRCKIDQWLDFFTNHLGRWLNAYAFEKVAKVKYGFGEPDKEAEKEAIGFIEQQMPAVDNHLGENTYFLGDLFSIADLIAFSYVENFEMAQLPFDDYPNVKKWYESIKSRDSIKRAHKKINEKSLVSG